MAMKAPGTGYRLQGQSPPAELQSHACVRLLDWGSARALRYPRQSRAPAHAQTCRRAGGCAGEVAASTACSPLHSQTCTHAGSMVSVSMQGSVLGIAMPLERGLVLLSWSSLHAGCSFPNPLTADQEAPGDNALPGLQVGRVSWRARQHP